MQKITSILLIIMILLNTGCCAILVDSGYTIWEESTIEYITVTSDSVTDTNDTVVFEENTEELYTETQEEIEYILNTNSMKFHFSYCGSAGLMSKKNKVYYFGTREELIAKGYSPCGNCDP